jgi:hypothetical protein
LLFLPYGVLRDELDNDHGMSIRLELRRGNVTPTNVCCSRVGRSFSRYSLKQERYQRYSKINLENSSVVFKIRTSKAEEKTR